MSKKTLPKAIRRASDDLGEVAAGHGVTVPRESLPGMSEGRDGAATSREPARASEAAPASQAPPTPVAGALARGTPVETDATRRRSLARAIVERHAAYAAVGGIIPVPIANVASITAVIVRMVKVLSGLYGVPFERDRARALVVGLMGGAMPTGLGAVTTSTLVYIVPASGLIGLAVSSVTAIACTRSIGRIFVEHFEGGATLQDLPSVDRN